MYLYYYQPKQKWLGIRSITVASSKHGFQRGVPFRAVHTPRNSKGKTTPIKNRPHSCGRLIHLQKRKMLLPLVLILLMRQDSTLDQPEASQLLHQKSIDFNCKNCFQRGMPYRAVHPPRNSKGTTTAIKNRPHSCGRLIH